jgi:hypothetical protein
VQTVRPIGNRLHRHLPITFHVCDLPEIKTAELYFYFVCREKKRVGEVIDLIFHFIVGFEGDHV